ncbi:uncharacterized protein isoform X3 [Macaca fascicularis]|uniref:uncharacterized protein isoform X3 n=1 Tax=Macaca fascicularis TaxID=9541 RepID=UPI003D15D49D
MSKMKALPNSTSGEGGFLTRRRLLPVSSHGLYSVRTWRESSPVPPSSDEVTSSISSRDGKSKIKALEDSLSGLPVPVPVPVGASAPLPAGRKT